MEWRECNLRGFVKNTFMDKNKIDALIKMSDEKLKVNNILKMGDLTASTKFTIVYDSLREILEALAIKSGFKIYNHECFSAFLKEVYGSNIFAGDFDRFRVIRNKINYYAKRIKVEESSILIKGMIKLRKNLLEKLK